MNFCSHHNIWRDAQVPQRTFGYYYPDTKGLDFAGLMNDIKVICTGCKFIYKDAVFLAISLTMVLI
jgi:aspartate aminotransferase